MGSARDAIRAFPKDARERVGYELYQVQCGLDPSDWKSMPQIGAGVREIRVHTRLEHRVIYIAQFQEGVYVLHAFEKKTCRTEKGEMDLARSRLRAVLGIRPARRRKPRSDR